MNRKEGAEVSYMVVNWGFHHPAAKKGSCVIHAFADTAPPTTCEEGRQLSHYVLKDVFAWRLTSSYPFLDGTISVTQSVPQAAHYHLDITRLLPSLIFKQGTVGQHSVALLFLKLPKRQLSVYHG